MWFGNINSKSALLGAAADLVVYALAPTRTLMPLRDLDLHGFQDISEFDGSQLLLSTGINTKSKCHDLKLFPDISVGFFGWFFSPVCPEFDILIRCE